MEKPIITTALKGLFLKSDPWEKAHIIWYEDREKEINEKKLDNSAIKEWRELLESDPEKENKEYFKYVDRVMRVLYPKLPEKEKTKKARELFFDATVKYIKKNTEVKNQEVIDYFNSLKKKYRLALITTNTPLALSSILKVSKLENLFDIIETSLPEEKDDKKAVFDRFIEKNGKPTLYIGNSKDALLYSKAKAINTLYANLENKEEIKGIKSINNLKELEEELKKFQK